MTDVVDRVFESTPDDRGDVSRSDARRVLTILIVFALVALLANFWL